MKTRTLLLTTTLAAAAILAGAATAQTVAPAAAAPDAPALRGAPLAAGASRHDRRAGPHAHRAARLAAAVRDDPALAVVINLRAIERLYRHEGRAKDLPAFYREQLGKTEDPLVRNFVHYRLARLELRADDADAALAALRRNLDENYRRL